LLYRKDAGDGEALRGADIAKSGCEESRMDGLPRALNEDFLEAEAEDESVVIARLAKVLMLPVASGTRGVMIQGELLNKRDDATMAASVRGGTPGDLLFQIPWGNKDYLKGGLKMKKKLIQCL